MRDLLLAFLFGVLLVGAGAFWYETKQTKEFGRALKLLKSGERAAAYTRSMSAYRDEEPSIAI